MISGLLNVSPAPKPTILIFGDTKKPKRKSRKKTLEQFKTNIFINLKNADFANFKHSENGREQKPDDPSKQNLNILEMGSTSINKNAKWECGHT